MKRDRIIYKVSQYLTLKEIGRAFFLSPTAVSNIINKRRNKNMQEIFKVVPRSEKYYDTLDKLFILINYVDDIVLLARDAREKFINDYGVRPELCAKINN